MKRHMRCPCCGSDKIVITTIDYRTVAGTFYFTVPNLQIPICQDCGEKVFTEEVDQQINKELANLK